MALEATNPFSLHQFKKAPPQSNIMNNEAQTWSESLQQLTRKAIRDMDVSPYDGNLHFKNHTTGHAIITAQDLICGKLSLIDKQSGQVSEFANADELLAAGWAVD